MPALPPDIMAALGGGGDPSAAGGLPPDIAAALGGGGEDAGPSISQGGSHGGGSDAIGQAIDLLNQAAIDEADEQDKQVILTCIANLQKVIANNQSDQDSLMQSKSSPRALRKATAGAGY